MKSDTKQTISQELEGTAISEKGNNLNVTNSPSVAEFRSRGLLQLSDEVMAVLDRNGIHTLADIRRVGVGNVEGLPANDPTVAILEAHANLNLICGDPVVNASLIDQGYTSGSSVARASRAEFVRTFGEAIGDYTAAQIHTVALAQTQLADNLLAAYGADQATGHVMPRPIPNPNNFFPLKCGCEDCEAAVSPRAYLADLLDYALTHLKIGGLPITLEFLTNEFHQPFRDLPAQCTEVDHQERQVRICVEALRGYQASLPQPPSTGSLEKTEREYLEKAYTQLLVKIGTTYEEIRLARSSTTPRPEDAKRRRALANRLGITPDHLDGLYLTPQSTNPTLTEQALEDLFGLKTTGDPLRPRGIPHLQAWQQEFLRLQWRELDFPADPYSTGRLPVIDPNLISPDDFRRFVAGEPAHDLWERRQASVNQFRNNIRQARESGMATLTDLLRQVLGNPLPDLAAIRTALSQGTDLEDTRRQITEDLHMTEESFTRLMEIKDKSDANQPISSDEWNDVYSILTQTWKMGQQFPIWVSEEQASGIILGPELFVTALRELDLSNVKWLATPQARRQWQEALRNRSQHPLVEPDQLDASYLKSLQTDPAYRLWQDRVDWIEVQRNALREDATHAVVTVNHLNNIIEQTLGVPSTTLDDLASQQNRGETVTERLDQLTLAADAFAYLIRLRELLTRGQFLLDSEQDEILDILVQVKKRRAYARWRDEERAANLTLGPEFFQIPKVDVTSLKLQTPLQFRTWRTSNRSFREWRETLESRIEQEQAVVQQLRDSVSSIEAANLPELRDGLLLSLVENTVGTDLDAKAKWFTERFFIDAKADGCQMTTRIAQTIETVQGLLFAVRNGEMRDAIPDLLLDPIYFFDEEWEWLGSYETWRAAMFVFLYPENVLLPNLKRWQTPAFIELVQELRSNRKLTPEQACEVARQFESYFRDVNSLILEASCHARTRVHSGDCRDRSAEVHRTLFYYFARGGNTNKVYWSAYDSSDGSGYAQTFWKSIPGLETGVVNLIGAVPYAGFIYIFARTQKKGKQKLVFCRYDLEQQRWSGEPDELELPPEHGPKTGIFSAICKQQDRDDRPPHLVIRRADGTVYERQLAVGGKDWSDGEWKPLFLSHGRNEFTELGAMIDLGLETGDFFLLMQGVGGRNWYRIFGPRDDGFFRLCPDMMEFKGAFRWPMSQDVVVFTGDTTGSSYRILSIADVEIAKDHVGIEKLDGWLDASGAPSLSTLIVEDNSLYGGMTAREFLTVDDQHDPYQIFRYVVGSEFYTQRVMAWIDAFTGRLDHDVSLWEWKLVDEYIRRFTFPGQNVLGLKEVLKQAFLGQNTDFVERQDPAPSNHFLAINDLVRIVPTSGVQEIVFHPHYPTLFPRVKQVALQVAGNEERGLHQTTFRREGQFLSHTDLVRIAPRVEAPLDVTERLSAADLQIRRTQITQDYLFHLNGPHSNLAYLEEAFYFVPIQLALKLQERGQYTAAVDWYRTVYDYSQPLQDRKIYFGLAFESWIPIHPGLPPIYNRAGDWLLDPLNPHAIAVTRSNTYTRFTVLSIIRCFLEFGDAEFTRDTAESVPRARTLYLTALDLLEIPELQQRLHGCDDVIGELDITVGGPVWIPTLAEIRRDLEDISDMDRLRSTVAEVREALKTSEPIPQRIANARARVDQALTQLPQPTFGTLLAEKVELLPKARSLVLGQPEVLEVVQRVNVVTSWDFRNAVVATAGIRPETLGDETVPLAWLRDDGLSGPALVLKTELTLGGRYIPAPVYQFCIPPNPILKALRMRSELNLYKIRHCQNIEGTERQLDPYAAPTDTVTGLPTVGGGQIVLPRKPVLKPTSYRYSVLIERAKYLVSLAQQVEAALLTALEKGDAERYTLLKARQDLGTAKATVRLQTLRIREAQSGVKLAELQKAKAELEISYWQELLQVSISSLEAASLGLLAATAAAEKFSANPDKSKILSITAQIMEKAANYERRNREWRFHRDIAQQDLVIAEQQINIAIDHVEVVTQEQKIAELQADHAEAVLEFLGNKFSNAQFYDWVGNILERVYSFLLMQATAVARLAENQLAFERQEVIPPTIQADYWEAPPEEAAGPDVRTPDRHGITGSARLLKDIIELDQHAFETNKRKLHLSKKILLPQLFPVEFQRLRETGVITFATPMQLFDRDFPGHYLRLIKQVHLEVLTNAGTNDPEIRATLTCGRTSRIVVGGDTFQEVRMQHGPDRITITSPNKEETGVSDKDVQSELLMPFEGLGVDTTWELQLPKAANHFDYNGLAGVTLRIDYTALYSDAYRAMVIQELDNEFNADRSFSLAAMKDIWNDLQNPDPSDTELIARFNTQPNCFPPNVANLRIRNVQLYVARADGDSFEVRIEHLLFTVQGTTIPVGGEAETIDGVISTRRTNGGAWAAMKGKVPFGQWELALPLSVLPKLKDKKIKDILVVITYSGETEDWPK